MSELPFVSVIMPVRNEAKYIERSLGAVLAQDYPADRMEVIVADGTPEAAKRLERVLTTDPGMGVVRHADAGYPIAIEAAKRHKIKMPMLK